MLDRLDRPPAGWFVLDVMQEPRKRVYWIALMIDIDPDGDDFKNHAPTRSVYVRVPGKHRNWHAAYEAIEDMLATRH